MSESDEGNALRRANRAAERLRLLGDVSEVLSGTIEQGIAVSSLAARVVPQLADWCIVTVQATDGLSRDLGWAHRDPAQTEKVGIYARQQFDNMSKHAAVSICLRTGEPVIVREMPDDLLDTWVPADIARHALGELVPGSVAVLPLKAAGRTLGAIALVTLRDRGPQSDGELEVAYEVARRAGLALDNARLYGQQRVLVTALQRSMLTEPPPLDALDVAVRYVPAVAEAQIGGDWYDVFTAADRTSVLVIGDAIGHDSRAAAAMGQLRGLLRGIAYTTTAGPADLLGRVDRAIDGLRVRTTASVIVASVSPPVQDDPHRQLQWSSAGHPPLVLRAPDGTCRLVESDPPDLLLGVDPATPRRDYDLELARGSTVLLYTDGLVEQRGMSIDDGLDSLLAAMRRHGHLPLEMLCDTLIADLLPPKPEDDIAIVAARVR